MTCKWWTVWCDVRNGQWVAAKGFRSRDDARRYRAALRDFAEIL